jgi:post-segregation antitoxin (ccd killing protein)
MTDSKNKERTSITIDPELLKEAREYCATASQRRGRKVSFSELVSTAVSEHIKLSQ